MPSPAGLDYETFDWLQTLAKIIARNMNPTGIIDIQDRFALTAKGVEITFSRHDQGNLTQGVIGLTFADIEILRST